LALDTRTATVVAAALLALAAGLRPVHARWSRWLAAASFETALVCALFALWQFANALTHTHVAGGLAHGRAVWHAERWLHVPGEAGTQQLILGHPTVVRAANYYYDTAHLTGMALFLVWLWLRHRDRYAQWRNVLVVFTAISLLIQTIPVAPPRLIGHTGLTDTAMLYGQSVYAVIGSNLADQYAAMPSIHVGWAVLIACAVMSASRSRWRWLGPAHAVATAFIVVATANHYWLDGAAAGAIVAFAWVAERRVIRPVTARARTAVSWLRPEPVVVGPGDGPLPQRRGPVDAAV
jgi:hypothetical protein